MSARMAPADSIEQAIAGRWRAVFGAEDLPHGRARVAAYRDNYRTAAGAKRCAARLKKHLIGKSYAADTRFRTAVVETTIKEIKPI